MEQASLCSASLDFSQVVKALQSPFHGIIHGDQWLVAHDLFGSLTAVIVERTRQCNSHWGESGLELNDRTDHGHQERQQQGQIVGHPVRDVVLGGLIIEACQDSGQECPERDGFVIGDVKSLEREQKVRSFSPLEGEVHNQCVELSTSCWLSQVQYFGKSVAVPCLLQLRSTGDIQPTQTAAFHAVLKSANVSQWQRHLLDLHLGAAFRCREGTRCKLYLSARILSEAQSIPWKVCLLIE